MTQKGLICRKRKNKTKQPKVSYEAKSMKDSVRIEVTMNFFLLLKVTDHYTKCDAMNVIFTAK